MNIIKVADYKSLSQKAAVYIAAQVIFNSRSVLGLATGSTPEGVYAELVNLYREGIVDFSETVTFNLDEYYGLEKNHEQSYRYYMEKNFFQHVNVRAENIHIPNGSTSDPVKECKHYEKQIETAGGIDLQLLGIGRNGHIGFNEPGDHFAKETYLVDLTEDTIEANARFFESSADVPRKALSMGITSIMQAKNILLIANGADKKDALEKMIYGPVTPHVPASVLQFHQNATVMYCD